MNGTADYVVAFANFAMACATLYLACQARKQLVFMRKESELAKFPNVVVFLSGLLTKAKPSVEHHEGYEPLGFVFFNANERSVVYLGGHLFKWSQGRPLTRKALKGLMAHFGDPDKGWLGFLNPHIALPDTKAPGAAKPQTVIVKPSGSIALIPNDANGFYELLTKMEGNTLYTLLVLTLAYPSTPGGIVMIGVPFKILVNVSADANPDVNLVGEMVTEQLIYSSIVKEKNVER